MKESVNHIDKDVIKRICFNSFGELSDNGGTATNITLLNGVATFNGTSSKVLFNYPINRTVSIRFKVKSITPQISTLLDFTTSSGTGLINLTSTTAFASSSGTRYVDGVATSTYSSTSTEFVVTGIAVKGTIMSMGVNASTANWLGANVEILEIYNRTLIATEVSELYKGTLYKKSNELPVLLNFNHDKGFVEEKINNNLIINGTIPILKQKRTYASYVTNYSTYYRITNLVAKNYLDDFTNKWVMSFWYKKISGINYARYVYLFGTSAYAVPQNGVILCTGHTDNTLSFQFGASGTYISKIIIGSDSEFLNNQFNHVCIIFDGKSVSSNLYCYINGILLRTNNFNFTLNSVVSSDGIKIGGDASDGSGAFGRCYISKVELFKGNPNNMNSFVTRLYNSQKGLYQ